MSRVVQFPGNKTQGGVAPKSHENVEVTPTENQKELFSLPKDLRGLVAFLSVDELDENRFLALLAKSQTKLLIDIRALPLFNPPKYSNDRIYDAFHNYEIKHVHYFPMLKLTLDEKTSPSQSEVIERRKEKLSLIENLISLSLLEGLVFVITDSNVGNDMILKARAELEKYPEFNAEISSRHIFKTLGLPNG